VLWQAQKGAVLDRSARFAAIAFDLSAACAGQRWTSEIMVQVTDAVTYDTVVSGTFIKVLVTSNRLLERTTWQLEGTQALSKRQLPLCMCA
jgi:hypothetical protein